MTAETARLSFSPEGLFVLNLALAAIVFSVSLYLRRDEVDAVRRQPRAVVSGLAAQWLWLPLMTLALIWVLRPHPGVAAGMLLVAACPGGSVSNFYTLIARGNTVLSIGLTTLATLAAVLVTPLVFGFGARLLPEPPQAALGVDVVDMLQLLVVVIILPLMAALVVRRFAPEVAARIRRPCRSLAGLLLLAVIGFGFFNNLETFSPSLAPVLGTVVLHNALAFAGGYLVAMAFLLREPERRAITFETGLQNAGLALVLVFNFFDGDGAMALVAAMWGLWHLLAGLGLARFWSRRRPD